MRAIICGLVLFAGGGVLQVNAASLSDLYHEAMASDTRLLQAESEAAIFEARARGNFANLLPSSQIAFRGNRTRRDSTNFVNQDTSDYFNGERYSFSLRQPLFNVAAWQSWRGASHEAEQYKELYNQTVSQLSVELAQRYMEILAAEDSYSFVVAERKAAQQQYKQIKARYERELSSVTDLLSVEARMNTLLSRELDAQNSVQLAREGMSEVLGRQVDEVLASLEPNINPHVELGVLDDWVRAALANNEQLEASRLALKAARSRLKEAFGQHYPTVTLSLSAQKSDIGFEDSQTPVNETYVAGVDVSIPLYSGGRVSANVDEANARLRMLESSHLEIERTLRRNVRQAYLNSRSELARVKATRTALISAEKSYEAQQRGYKFGTVTIVDVLNASEVLYETRRDNKQAYYDLILESLTLYQVAGEFSDEKIMMFDAWLKEPEGVDF